MISRELVYKLNDEIKRLEQNIQQWQDEQPEQEFFKAWFDASLFSPSCQRPMDYLTELKSNGRQLLQLYKNGTAETDNAEQANYLENKVANQLSALHTALHGRYRT